VNLLKTEMEYGMIKWIVWERKDTKMSFWKFLINVKNV
jgi:hypothetical protein